MVAEQRQNGQQNTLKKGKNGCKIEAEWWQNRVKNGSRIRARMVAEQGQNGQQNTLKNGGSIGARMVAK